VQTTNERLLKEFNDKKKEIEDALAIKTEQLRMIHAEKAQ
jgi:hypothetical protein